jgi:hypothetical protein
MKKTLLFVTIVLIGLASCKKKGCTDVTANNFNSAAEKDDGSCEYDAPAPNLILKLKFDSTQQRLDSFGNPETVPAANSAQSPVFHGLSAHFIELTPNQNVLPGDGVLIYKGAETTAGGNNAADFSQAIVRSDGEVFYSIPLSSIAAGTYEYLRVSVTYQNYDIDYYVSGTKYTGRIASFVGWNTYLTSYVINTQTVTVNSNKLQGYWGFESASGVIEGQTPPGATTVPNPIAGSSPIPAGSCLVTGEFASPLVISGNETNDIVVTISLSVNKSFEWKDDNTNGLYEPLAGDTVVNMGLRGLIPIIE